jgi:hypothetical protein
MVVNVGTNPKYQILPQRNTCLNNLDDCLTIEMIGGIQCVDVHKLPVVLPTPTNFSPTIPTSWTPDCNQDMTVKNGTDPVIIYAQNP